LSPFARYLRFCAAGAGLLTAAFAGVNWYIDPLQHYRPAKYPALLVEPARYRLPGVARHTTATIAIAGTSVSKNQQPADVQRVFGGETVNLAMEGASAHEQYLLLRLALRKGDIREVIWDVNFEYLRGTPDWVSDYDGAFPGYLYDDSKLNDIGPYLLNLDTCKNSFRVLARKLGVPAYQPRTLESFLTPRPGTKFGPDAVNQAAERRRKQPEGFRALLPQFTREKLRTSFERNYLALAREFPETRFRLHFPPFSSTYFVVMQEVAPELAEVILAHREDVVTLVASQPNVELHDPQSDLALISELSRYSDPIHFGPGTYVDLLAGIKDGRWKSTAARLDSFAQWLRGLRTDRRAEMETPPPQ
jgi:hypothetical protein